METPFGGIPISYEKKVQRRSLNLSNTLEPTFIPHALPQHSNLKPQVALQVHQALNSFIQGLRILVRVTTRKSPTLV